jgi:protoporphyrinogen oxidase
VERGGPAGSASRHRKGVVTEAEVVVIGAGVSGLSLAWRLAQRGISVCVLEADGVVGGLAKTHRENGCAIDVGAHSFFSDDGEILQTVFDLLGGPLTTQQRRVKLLYQGRFVDYPLSTRAVVFQMGLASGVAAVTSFLAAKAFYRLPPVADPDDYTVEEWAIANFGRHLYRTFFKPYTEQFWKLPCSELSARTIPTHTRMSFLHACGLLVRRAVSRGDMSLVEREALPMYYPPGGFGAIAEAIAQAAVAGGAKILVNSPAVRVEFQSGSRARVHYEGGGTSGHIDGGHVVSTVPLDRFISMLDPGAPSEVRASAARLEYRALRALGMVTDRHDILGCNYVYVLNRPYQRVTEMNTFSPHTSPPGHNILMIGVPCVPGSVGWEVSKEELFDMCIGPLSSDGFLDPGDVLGLVQIKSPAAYPVYRKGYRADLSRVLAYIAERGQLDTLGRCGEFRYQDVDRCMQHAFRLAERITARLRGSESGGSAP